MTNNELKKIKEIDDKIKNLKQNLLKKPKKIDFDKNFDPFTIAIELVSSVCVGIFIGILLYRVFDFSLYCVIITSALGTLAGCKIIWQKINKKKDVS